MFESSWYRNASCSAIRYHEVVGFARSAMCPEAQDDAHAAFDKS